MGNTFIYLTLKQAEENQNTGISNEFLVKTFNEVKDFGKIKELLIDYTKNIIEIKRRET